MLFICDKGASLFDDLELEWVLPLKTSPLMSGA
jgi:hypothetical protein